jgi:glycosyltransferase involved in cell wall biosynthesis
MNTATLLTLLLPQLFVFVALLLPFVTLRRVISGALAVVGAIATGVFIGSVFKPWVVIIAVIGIYQLLNVLRLVENRMHWRHQRSVVARTTTVLLLSTCAVLLAVNWLESTSITQSEIFLTSAIFTLVCSIVVFTSTIINTRRTKPISIKNHLSDKELPTLSVLLPARNEDNDLTDCLHNLLKSDYPKLEIIVLDDCSFDRSSDIIKSFAHKGVRFISGEPPKENWLAKNQAYQTLAEAASGDWLLFSGVDVRVDPKTLRNIVTHIKEKKVRMIGVLPRRPRSTFTASFFSPLRYWYELSFPRELLQSPPILSTFWGVEKKYLHKLGGFGAVTRSILPESYFAKAAYKQNEYTFVRSSNDLVVTTEKSLKNQVETAVRTRYPQTHKKIEYVAAITTVYILLVTTTTFGFVYALITSNVLLAFIAGLSIIFFNTGHVLIVALTCRSAVPASIINFPILLLQEIVLFNISLYKYEFSKVDWKGRNICYPIMHITPRLPSID